MIGNLGKLSVIFIHFIEYRFFRCDFTESMLAEASAWLYKDYQCLSIVIPRVLLIRKLEIIRHFCRIIFAVISLYHTLRGPHNT